MVSLIVLTSSDAIDANAACYNVAEAGLGVGSLFFCALLFRTRLVPRWLAARGFIGYACFAGGNLLELFGVAGAALVASIPGGLFELTFAIWLIARGFASTEPSVRARPPDWPERPARAEVLPDNAIQLDDHVIAGRDHDRRPEVAPYRPRCRSIDVVALGPHHRSPRCGVRRAPHHPVPTRCLGPVQPARGAADNQ